MTPKTTVFAFFAAALAAVPGAVQAEVITGTAVTCTSSNTITVASVLQGCQAQASYLTGTNTGGTIHTVDFNTGTASDPFGVATYSGSGLQMSTGAEPRFDATAFISAVNGSYTINFNTAIVFFGLQWGTNGDATDTITVNNVVNGVTTTIQTFNGTSFAGWGSSYNTDAYVSLNASGGTFNQIVIANANCCFETDNHAYVTAASVAAAPEPSTFGIAALGLVGLGAKWQRKRRVNIAR